MAKEQSPPSSSQNTASQWWLFRFDLQQLFIVVSVLAAYFAFVGFHMRADRRRLEGHRIAHALAMRAIVAEACPDLNLKYGGGGGVTGGLSDIHRMTALWKIGPNNDIPAEVLVRLEEETKRRLKDLHVEIIDMGGLSGPASNSIQVGYRYRSVRGFIQFCLIRNDRPESWAKLDGKSYLTGTHVQFR